MAGRGREARGPPRGGRQLRGRGRSVGRGREHHVATSSAGHNSATRSPGNVLQGTASNSLLLKASTKVGSIAFRSPDEMQRFVNAAITECAVDATFVLDRLGSQDNEGLCRLREICTTPFSAQADNTRSTASFQRVVCALLHLLTLPAFANTVLNQCYNPILTVVENSLDMRKVCKCVLDLSKQGATISPHCTPVACVWQPSTWVELVQTVVSFLAKLMSRSGILSEEKLDDMRSHITQLQNAFQAFQSRGSSPGENSLHNNLDKLNRLVASKQEEHQGSKAQSAESARLGILRHQRQTAASVSQAHAAQPGPGEHRAEGPRHNNDHASISNIRIAPTQEEMLCQIPPYLPSNQAGMVVHLPQGSQAAHLDMQFRLFRHDGLGELFRVLQNFNEAGGIASLGPQHGKGCQQLPLPSAVQDKSLQVYISVQVEDLLVPKRGPSVSFEVTFDDLASNSKSTVGERQAFWEKTKRLGHGTLVLLWTETPLHGPGHARGAFDINVTPCVVSDRDVDCLAPRNRNRRPAIGLRLCEGVETSSNLLVAATGGKLPGKTVLLQATGGSSYFAFEPFLKALQRNQTLPLADRITQLPASTTAAGSSSNSLLPKVVPPPAYMVDMNARDVSLSSLIAPGMSSTAAEDALSHVDVLHGGWGAADETLTQYSTLDPAQRLAIKAALTSELVLIQGPPGTGKSHVGIQLVKLLTANTCSTSAAADKHQLEHPELPRPPVVGPIRIVCLTNHALDQFLEALHDAGITDMVRVGTGCKTDALLSYTLQLVSKNRVATQAQRHLQHSCHARCEELTDTIKGLQHQLKTKQLSWATIEDLLPVMAPLLHHSLMSKHQKQTHENNVKDARTHLQQSWRRWLYGKDDDEASSSQQQTAGSAGPSRQHAGERDVPLLLGVPDAWSMTRGERQKLYRYMVNETRSEQLAQLKRAVKKFAEVREELRCVYADVDLSVLKGAQVVGMTTNGVASKQELVAAMGSKVVLVEEAAEVMETQILASLAPSVEHAIFIGDHEQLRPKANLWEMQVESRRGHNLDMSFFERLVSQGHPVVTLQQQRRMQPSISALVRPLYPHLQDHAQVLSYPPVRGMAHNIFFWDHEHPEGGNDDSKSKVNLVEAQMAARLALYMVQQGYAAGEVTILTPYVGQLRVIARELGKLMDVVVGDTDAEQLASLDEADGTSQAAPTGSGNSGCKPVPNKTSLKAAVRVATIDNFQGEESTIVILSLVRSNEAGRIGFLATSNRVNVMLSRAKHGLYILGNQETLTAKKRTRPTMLTNVLDMQQEAQAVGQALPIVCSQHQGTTNFIKTAEEFDVYAKDGGCSLPCETRLLCGHVCPRQCHPDDQAHVFVKCTKDCQRLQQPCGHPCPKMCHEDCGKCKQEMTHVALPCGHTADKLPCHIAQAPEQYLCKQKVEVQMQCNHLLQVSCCDADKFRADASQCSAQCGWDLPCGHACRQRCGQCLKKTRDAMGLTPADISAGAPMPRSNYNHPACSRRCGRDLLCGHDCKEPCHGGTTCPPCSQPCKAACNHGRCKRRCTDPCQPCAEPCAWRCPHQGQCDLPCGAPCSRLPCDKRCCKKLSCGHQCPGICGEICPSKKYCIHCGDAEITAYDAMMNEHNKLQLYSKAEHGLDIASDPLVFLGCGHVIHMSTMDHYMSLDEVYGKDEGQWTAPCQLGAEKKSLKSCLLCRQPLHQVMRYGRILNKMKLDQADIQFAGQCHILLDKADALFQQAAAAGQSAHLQGVAAQPQAQPARVPHRTGHQHNRRQLPVPVDDKVKALKEARRKADEAKDAFEALKKTCRRPPTVAVHESTVATLQRLAKRQANQATFPPTAASTSTPTLASTAASTLRRSLTHVPRPDRRPECKAYIGLCQSNALWSTINVQLMHHKLHGHIGVLDPTSKKLKEVKELWAGATSRYKSALAQVQHAIKLAEQELAQQTALQAAVAYIKLQQQRVQDLGTRREFQHVLGVSTEDDKQAEADQLHLLAEADEVWSKARNQATESSAASVLAVLASLQAAFASLRKLVEKPVDKYNDVQTSELKAVVRALVSSAPSLADAGFTNQGHWYECPNGHPYIITECGAATQLGTCFECGASIGGSRHQVRAGNRESTALRSIAAEVARPR